jgi:hypothetical protein
MNGEIYGDMDEGRRMTAEGSGINGKEMRKERAGETYKRS